MVTGVYSPTFAYILVAAVTIDHGRGQSQSRWRRLGVHRDAFAPHATLLV